MDKGKVLKLRDLNAGFTKPDTIALAYYEASLLVDHIVEVATASRRLNALVRSYADGIDTEAALKSALNVSIEDLQVSFDRALDDAVRRHPAGDSRRRYAGRRQLGRGAAGGTPPPSRTATSRSSRWGRRWPTARRRRRVSRR